MCALCGLFSAQLPILALDSALNEYRAVHAGGPRPAPPKHFPVYLFAGMWYDLDMPSLTAKQIDGHTYYYARYCQRVDGKPKIVRQVYLGKIEDLVAAAELSHQPPQPLDTAVAAFADVTALFDIASRLDLVR